MEIGDGVPDVTVTGRTGPIALAALPAPLVVYFYPKNDTPGCTREAQDFSALAAEFASLGVQVIGVSRDPIASHVKFAAKHALTVELASDADGAASEAFGVWGEKQLYGRTYLGVERATFLFDRERRLVRIWHKVRVAEHAAQVLASARNLLGSE